MSMDGRLVSDSRVEGKAGQGRFAQLAFSKFHDALYRYLLRKIRSAENAEDLAQEIYLRLLRVTDRSLVRNPQAYVFGVAFNVLYEFRLHQKRNLVDFDSQAMARLEEDLVDEVQSPDEIDRKQEMTRWLDGVLMNLSPMQQAVLLMAKRQGLAHAQIAEKLGISIGTVRKHLSRAVSHCRKAMEE